MKKSFILLLSFLIIVVSAPAYALNGASFYFADRAKNQPKSKVMSLGDSSKNATAQAISLSANPSYRESYDAQGTTQRYLRDGERFLLPAETRVPDELKPLLMERLTPQQGLSMTGGTGAVLIPSPGVLDPGKTAVGIHIHPFELRNINDQKYTDETYFDTVVTLAYGIENGVEVSIDKTFSNQDRYDLHEPVYVNAKYQFPGNITMGGSFKIQGEGYNSLWLGTGVPIVWVGVGVNFGPEDFKFSYTKPTFGDIDKFKRAKYGGYNYSYSKATGYADPVYFMVGGMLPLNDNLRFVYDFNGDKFSLGVRVNYLDSFFLNASFVSEGKYENLPGAIAHKNLNTFVAGCTLVY